MQSADKSAKTGSVPDRLKVQSLSDTSLARLFHQPALIYFNAVARTQSVRQAARNLNVASSAVTRQIASLEDTLGVELFHRSRQRIRLSPAGEVLYRHTARMAGPLQAAINELDMLRGHKSGRVRIVSVESIGLSALPELIARFNTAYPRLSLDISILPAEQVVQKLLREDADIGFGFIAELPKGIEISTQKDVPIGVLLHADHPLVKKDRLRLTDCLDYPVAVAKPEISIRKVLEPYLGRATDQLPPMIETDSIRLMVELALSGQFVSLSTPLGAQHELDAGRLVFRTLDEKGLPANRFGILMPQAAPPQFASAVFYEHATAYFENLPLPGSAQGK